MKNVDFSVFVFIFHLLNTEKILNKDKVPLRLFARLDVINELLFLLSLVFYESVIN
jgi:hypothetical protein